MRNNIRFKRSIRVFLMIFFGVLLYSNSSVAQDITVKGTQMSDGSAPNTLRPLDFSQLELNSTERGFLMPRMTTVERMRIPVANLSGGMIIYNTSIDCVEFYNVTRNQWMSACGDVEPAIFTIPDEKCRTIKISGEYAEKVFLDSRKHVISVDVSVSSPGTYDIEAVAFDKDDKLNGYTFKANGVFPSEGSFTVILKGYGTPQTGYPRQVNGEPTAKDKIVFFLNNLKASCTIENIVDTKALTYDLVDVIQTGDFFTGVNVLDPKTTGKVKVSINNISQAGLVEIKTLTQNGISFSGRRMLTQTEVNNKQAVIDLVATGVPSTPINLPFDFISNSYVRLEDGENQKFLTKIISIAQVNVSSNCSEAIISKEFLENEVLTDSHIITVPIKVTATGRGRIIGTVATNNEQKELIEYTSDVKDFVFNPATNDVMNIEMRPVVGTGKPTVGGKNIQMHLQLSSKGVKEYDSSAADEQILKNICDLNIFVKSNWSVINTSSVVATFYSTKQSMATIKQYNGLIQGGLAYYIPPYTKMPESGHEVIRVELSNVKPTTTGKWEFETEPFNGVIFKGEGQFLPEHINNNQTLILKAYGIAGLDKPRQIISIYNKQYPGVSILNNLDFVKRLEIDYVYEPMVIYSIGDDGQSWHPGGRNAWSYSGGPQLIRSKDNFGFNGIVRIDDLSIMGITSANNNGYGVNTVPDIKDNSTVFNENLKKSEIVVIGGGGSNAIIQKGTQQLEDLAQSVKDKKVALIYGEGDPTYMRSFIYNLTGSTIFTSSPGTSNAKVTTPYFIGSTVMDKLIWGDGVNYFGKYEGVALKEKSINGSYYGAGATFTITSLPTGFIGIAGSNASDPNSESFAYMHSTYGFVGIGNQGFMGGRNRNTTGDSGWPSTSTSAGVPVKGVNQLNSNVESRNSWFMLNLMQWAIDYNQKNNPKFKKE